MASSAEILQTCLSGITRVKRSCLVEVIFICTIATAQHGTDVIVVIIVMWTGPSSEDLEAFVSYLIQLIHGCDLEHVALLLRFVQRFVMLLWHKKCCKNIKRYKNSRSTIFEDA